MLRDFQRSIDRYLLQCKFDYSIIRDPEFSSSREALSAKMKQLRKCGKGRKPNKAAAIENGEIEELWESKQLGFENPISLINTVWFNNTTFFGWRGNDEHSKLKFGDLVLKSDENNEYVECNVHRKTTRYVTLVG